jgi:hypothetical protein
MMVTHVFVAPGGSYQTGSVDYDYRYALSHGWTTSLYVVMSIHNLRDGTIPDTGYTYQLSG